MNGVGVACDVSISSSCGQDYLRPDIASDATEPILVCITGFYRWTPMKPRVRPFGTFTTHDGWSDTVPEPQDAGRIGISY